MNTLKETKSILNKYGLKANKRFGQNFLVDDNILNNIVEVSNIKQNELIIEIGPGLGNLTNYILSNATYSLLIEVDNNMIKVINDRFKDYDNYTLISQDILKVNIDEEILKIEEKNNIQFTNVKVVANLPYYITTPIIFKLLQDSKRISEVIVMVQKEVAQRMVAQSNTKDYGILTLMVQYLSDASIAFLVPKDSFIPAPNVTSAIIVLKKNKKYKVKNEEVFIKLVHCAFAKRRKTMINSLFSTKFNNFTKGELIELFNKLGIDGNVRAEQLEIEDFITISNEI